MAESFFITAILNRVMNWNRARQNLPRNRIANELNMIVNFVHHCGYAIVITFLHHLVCQTQELNTPSKPFSIFNNK